MEHQKNGWVIKVPGEKDLESLWNIMNSLHLKQKAMMEYEDCNTRHTKETLEQLLRNGEEEERIWAAFENEKMIGFIDIQYKKPDYLFFDDKYVFIRYFYVEECENACSEDLINTAIEDAKKYGFEYICGDVISKDSDMEKMYMENHFEHYRIRLSKELIYE